MVGDSSISDKQYRLVKRSMAEAIKRVMELAEKEKIGNARKRGFCELISINV